MANISHKAGFVSIIGKPNVGKSTLMNQMVGERLSIITSKAQTTRHRIMGIINGDDFQIVYSDTPGILKPEYELHQSMMRFVNMSLDDADAVLLVADLYEKIDEELLNKLKSVHVPVILIINKSDLAKGTQLEDKITYWKEHVKYDDIIVISALKGENIDKVFECIIEKLPIHPPYFPKDQLTDKPERFFAAEIIREKIFLNYKKEVPYSCEVVVNEFKEEEKIIRIRGEIYVERKSQRGILIGNKGAALKKVGTEARLDMEAFFGKKVFLETHVKVESDWRKKDKKLKGFGYSN
ncbi:MAG: GTPase Era [Cyclobacteriaceae bacterium]|nr:GTPase Era [Cyclobacteriaceae bacterium]